MIAFGILRITGALVLLLPSLLTVLPPGLNALWKLSIPVKEAGFFLTIPCILLAWWVVWGSPAAVSARVAGALLLAVALLYAYPLVRAVETAYRLEKSFAEGFVRGFEPHSPAVESTFQRTSPLVWTDFVRGIPTRPSSPPRTLVYAGDGERALRLDFYPASHGPNRPASQTNAAPCVVVIHGGGWDSGNREQLPDLNPWLAGAGYAVAAIDYRLAPDHIFPAPVEDVQTALAYLKANAAELGIDPARFVLLGRSAGGQVALQAAYTLDDPSIRGVAAYYAPADMVFGYSLPGNPLILDSRKVMDQYLGGSCAEQPELCRASSPIEFADANSPPTLLLHGQPDVLVSPKHTDYLEQRLAALGVPHFSVKLPWATHGYDYVFSGLGSQISLFFLERFLAKVIL